MSQPANKSGSECLESGPGFPGRRASMRTFVPLKIGMPFIVAAFIITGLSVVLLSLTRVSVAYPLFDVQVKAAQRMESALEVLKIGLLEQKIPVETDLDPNATGLVGPEWTPLTTTLGILEAKRTVLNPNFAALMVRYFHEAGLRSGDVVAVGASGSFPGLVIATLCAAREMELQAVTIASFGSSMYGATRPEFTVPDMIHILARAGLIPDSLAAVSPGGDADAGRSVLFEDSRSIILSLEEKAARLSGAEIVDFGTPDLVASIQSRIGIYKNRAAGKPVSCFVNIGGASPNSGESIRTLDFPQGLVLDPPGIPSVKDRGLIYEYALQGVPVINLLNVRGLAQTWGLPYDPVPLPRPGEGAVFGSVKYSKALICMCLALILGILLAGARRWRRLEGGGGQG